jgi:hypothetical protein
MKDPSGSWVSERHGSLAACREDVTNCMWTECHGREKKRLINPMSQMKKKKKKKKSKKERWLISLSLFSRLSEPDRSEMTNWKL